MNTKTYPNDWAAKIKEQNNGQGIDLLIDYIGASAFQQNLEVMNRDGRIVQLGQLGGPILPDGTNISQLLAKRLRFEGSTLRSRDEEYQSKLRELFEEKVFEDMRKGKFDIKIDTVVSWQKIAEMHQKLENNKTKGKIICVID